MEQKLKSCEIDKPKLIVVDGIYSMEGDIAPLPQMCDLKEKYNALLMVDDAHGLGVLGRNGRGTSDHFGVTDRVDLIMGTFSKSFGSLGGFIAGNSNIINYIKHNSRSLIFSASMPPTNIAAASKAIDIMLEEPQRIKHLWDLADYARAAFRKAGFNTGNSESPILPLFVGDMLKAMSVVHLALDEGIFVTPVIPPAVPQNGSMIRFALMATHTFEQVDIAVEKLTSIFKKLEIL